MLEVVFGQSIAGAIKWAKGSQGYAGGAVSVFIHREGDGEPTEEECRELQRLQQEAQERERQNWAGAIPLEGDSRDVLTFSLALSMGDIDEDGIGPKRLDALRALVPEFPEAADEMVEGAQRDLSTLLRRAEAGEPLRVWGSANPDEACGLCWLMDQLRPLGWDRLDVTLVKLPALEERPDGTAVEYLGWGDVEPYRLGRMAQAGERLSAPVMGALALRWRELRRENAPLRCVLNGRLVSAAETLYDPYIRREIALQDREFHEAVVIGNVLGKYRLGIGDSWVALRIEDMIQKGLLEPMTQAEAGGLSYHRTLRKRTEWEE